MAVVTIIKTKNNSEEIPSILKTPAQEVKTFDEIVRQIATDLIDTALDAKNPEAAGLAAPQIGINARVCLVRRFTRIGEKQIIKNYILVNPKVVSKSKNTDTRWEACLSVPNLYGRVQRAKKISIEAQDETGKKIKIKAEGFFARIIQHEMDHLDGILFTQKVVGRMMTEEQMDKEFES